MKKLVFKINSNGELTVDAEGFSGGSCLEKSRKYLESLGKETDSQKKPEFYNEAEVTVSN